MPIHLQITGKLPLDYSDKVKNNVQIIPRFFIAHSKQPPTIREAFAPQELIEMRYDLRRRCLHAKQSSSLHRIFFFDSLMQMLGC